MDEMQMADELLPKGTSKLQAALSSGLEGAKVACLMTDTAKAKSKGEAKGGYTINQRLLVKALPAGCFCCTIREKKVKVNVNCHFLHVSVKNKFCCVSNHLLD